MAIKCVKKKHPYFKQVEIFLSINSLQSHFSHVRLCVTPQTVSPRGSPVPGSLQARTLEWVAISFSNK